MIFVALLAAPYIIFYRTSNVDREKFSNRAMVYIARGGRYCGAFLMAFNIGILERGFTEPAYLMERFWLIVTACCVALCLLSWFLFFKTEKKGFALAVVLLNAFILMFSGLLQVKTLLLTAGLVYLIGELYMFMRYFSK